MYVAVTSYHRKEGLKEMSMYILYLWRLEDQDQSLNRFSSL